MIYNVCWMRMGPIWNGHICWQRGSFLTYLRRLEPLKGVGFRRGVNICAGCPPFK
jgi:hypothetical protein